MSDHQKYRAAQTIEALFRKRGYSIQLGGGGGASALGGPRPLKDLDYKMGERLQKAWEDSGKRAEIVKYLGSSEGLPAFGFEIVDSNFQSTTQLKYVLRMKIRDRLDEDPQRRHHRLSKKREFTHKSYAGSRAIEVSLTKSGSYGEKSGWVSNVGPALYLQPVSPLQMILDKTFVFVQRELSETSKLVTDFTDLAALLERFDVAVNTDLLDIRAQGYAKAQKRHHDWDSSLPGEARKRIDLIYDKLIAYPSEPAGPTQEIRDMSLKLKRQEVLRDIARVNRFLDQLALALPEICVR